MSISLSKAVEQKILSSISPSNSNMPIEEIYTKSDVIHYQSDNVYSLFKNKEKLLGSDVYEEFIKLMKIAININNKYEGEKVITTRAILNNENTLISIQENLLSMIKKYCKQRISKANNKDSDNVAKFIRLIDEFSVDLYKFASLKNTLNMCFLEKSTKYIVHYFSSNLIRKTSYKSIINALLELPNLDNTKKQSVDEIKKELQTISKDILYKKQYIIYKDININNIKIVPKKIYLNWKWDIIDNNISQICLNNDLTTKINITHRGYLVDVQNDLCDTNELYEQSNDIKYFELNILLMRKIQLHISSVCTKEIINSVDNHFVLQSISNDETVKDIEKITNNKNSLKDYNIKSKTHWGKFLRYLSKYFNVAIEQGKGADKKIYIKNSANDNDKIYRTSQIKNHKEIFPKTQENVLKKIGISPQEWLSKAKFHKIQINL